MCDNCLDHVYPGKINLTADRHRPPEGLKPKWLHDYHRMLEISVAVQRYLEHEKPIPTEWIEEFNLLLGKYNNHLKERRNADNKM